MKVLVHKKRIRSSVGAGIFYPDNKSEILELFRTYDLNASTGGHARAIIAPHGAWDFSGALAAYAFSSAMGRSGAIKRVVILGPIHDKREKGIFLSNSHSFHTPLGNIPVDYAISEKLQLNSRFFEIDDVPHLREHSIEILLPFVKYCFPSASIVPILMGQPRKEFIKDLAKALKTVMHPILEETLFVVSCNLSCDNDTKTAQFLAQECLRLFSQKDAPALVSAFLNGGINACGGGLVAGLFESGLLDKDSCFASEYMLSAVSSENNTVFYSAVSFE